MPLAREAVEERLASCVQIDGPITSFYRWDGELVSDKEYRLTFKFLAVNAERLEVWLNRNHPYEVPEWLMIKADRTDPAYQKWAESNAEAAAIINNSNKDLTQGVD